MAVINLNRATNPSPEFPCFPDNAVSVTPSDADTFNSPIQVFVGGDGDVAVLPWGAVTPVTFKGLTAGSMVPVRVKAVLATAATGNTTATNLIGVY